MTPEEKKLLELLEFSVNEKANNATAQKQQCTDENKSLRANFFQGQFIAFSEVYTMIQNLKRTL